MANGAFKFKDNSGNVVSFISGSGSNISFSGGTLDLSGMTGLTLGNLTLSGTTQNALSASHAASYLLTSSFNTYSGTTDTVIGTLQTSTGSLNSFSSSATTRLNSIETSTGSLNSYTSSNNTKLGVIESTTGSLNSYTSSNTTNVNAIHTSTGSLNTFTSSATTRLDNIETSTGSLNSFTSSATTRLNSIEGVSGSYATTGSNQFKNDQVITGSLTVTGFIDAQELRTTYISSSILYRSGSTKFGDELSDNHSFTGSLLVSGTISVPGSNLVSGSSQVLNGSGVFSGSAQLPSGIVSSSAQTIANLPSGTVSGSVQVDVMSTTNIARLATTGSNVFTGALTGTTATFSGALSATYGTFTSQVTVASPFTIKDTNPYIQWQNSSATRLGYIQHSTNLVMSADSGNVILTTTSGTFTLTSSGPATFNSSVQATDFRYTNTGYITYDTANTGTESLTIRKYGTAVLTLDSTSRASFGSTVFVGGHLFFDANGTVKTISNYGYGGAIQLLRSDSTSTRWARIGMVDATATNFLGGMTINNDTSATFSNNLTLSSSSSTTDLGGVLIVRGNGSAYSTHYLTTGAANVAKYIQYDASGNAKNEIFAGGNSYITGGNFGIGTNSPNVKLEIKGSIRLDSRSKVDTGEIDSITFTKDRPDASTGTYEMGAIRSFTNGGYAGGLTFYSGRHTGNGNYGLISVMTIGSTSDIGLANVGIGNTSPRTRLQVTPASNAETPVLGTATGAVTFTSANTNYGIQFNSTSDGSYFIQSQRFDASATAYALGLNPVGGYVYLGKGWGALNHRINLEVAQGNNILVVSAYAGASNDSVIIRAASGANPNAALSVMEVTTNSSTGRSISAGGTINASGNDYAEYMLKGVTDNISKGDIVGIDNEGLLTNIFSDAMSFVVKSTNPSYVGGDAWGNIVGKRPSRTTDQTEEDFAPILAEFETRLEIERQKVDRIAFSGQVPVNVTGSTVGDYIIPISTEDGKITGQAITNPSFEQYKISVGKVWKIMEDGRSFIAVKIG